MKNIIKIAVLIAILIAIFGATTTKTFLYKGVDYAVEGIETGVNKIKKPNQTPAQSIVNGIKDIFNKLN